VVQGDLYQMIDLVLAQASPLVAEQDTQQASPSVAGLPSPAAVDRVRLSPPVAGSRRVAMERSEAPTSRRDRIPPQSARSRDREE